MPHSKLYYSTLFGFLEEQEKEFAAEAIPVVTTGILKSEMELKGQNFPPSVIGSLVE